MEKVSCFINEAPSPASTVKHVSFCHSAPSKVFRQSLATLFINFLQFSAAKVQNHDNSSQGLLQRPPGSTCPELVHSASLKCQRRGTGLFLVCAQVYCVWTWAWCSHLCKHRSSAPHVSSCSFPVPFLCLLFVFIPVFLPLHLLHPSLFLSSIDAFSDLLFPPPLRRVYLHLKCWVSFPRRNPELQQALLHQLTSESALY